MYICLFFRLISINDFVFLDFIFIKIDMSNLNHTLRIPPVILMKFLFKDNYIYIVLNRFVQFENLLEVMNGQNQHLIRRNLVNFKNKSFQI